MIIRPLVLALCITQVGCALVVESGSTIWQYTSVDEIETEVGLLFLFHFDVQRDRLRQLFFEIEDEIVIDYWLDFHEA